MAEVRHCEEPGPEPAPSTLTAPMSRHPVLILQVIESGGLRSCLSTTAQASPLVREAGKMAE